MCLFNFINSILCCLNGDIAICFVGYRFDLVRFGNGPSSTYFELLLSVLKLTFFSPLVMILGNNAPCQTGFFSNAQIVSHRLDSLISRLSPKNSRYICSRLVIFLESIIYTQAKSLNFTVRVQLPILDEPKITAVHFSAHIVYMILFSGALKHFL